jgi:hypothetical protein
MRRRRRRSRFQRSFSSEEFSGGWPLLASARADSRAASVGCWGAHTPRASGAVELPRSPRRLLRRSSTPCSSSSWPSDSIIQVYPIPLPTSYYPICALPLTWYTTNSRVQSTWVCSRNSEKKRGMLLDSKLFLLDRSVSSLGYVE